MYSTLLHQFVNQMTKPKLLKDGHNSSSMCPLKTHEWSFEVMNTAHLQGHPRIVLAIVTLTCSTGFTNALHCNFVQYMAGLNGHYGIAAIIGNDTELHILITRVSIVRPSEHALITVSRQCLGYRESLEGKQIS